MMRSVNLASPEPSVEQAQAEETAADYVDSTRRNEPISVSSTGRADSLQQRPYAKDVFQCFASFCKGNQIYIGKTHLIFQKGMPFAVLEWEDVPGGRAPAALVPLDREWLHGPDSRFQDHSYCYRHTIDWLDVQSPALLASE
jgi:hypothetical protein